MLNEGATIFPFTIDGTMRIAVPKGVLAPQETALSGLATGLEQVRASTIAREGSWVLFYVRFFRLVMNSNLLVPVESGAISAEVDGAAIRISYRLRTVRFCVMVTAMALFAAMATYFGDRDLIRAAGMGLLVWFWLFGASYLLTLVRFRWFVKRWVGESLADARRNQRAA